MPKGVGRTAAVSRRGVDTKSLASTLPVVAETMKAVDAYETSQRPWGATGAAAVELCHQWMLRLGATDTVVAREVASEVCDLYSSRYLGWVESRRGNLDLAVVERAALISSSDGRAALVFVAGGVFPTVQDRADALAVGLLRFDTRAGDLDGANGVGRRILASGLVAA